MELIPFELEEVVCSNCKEKFKDNYIDRNGFNKRMWCNKCVRELWKHKD